MNSLIDEIKNRIYTYEETMQHFLTIPRTLHTKEEDHDEDCFDEEDNKTEDCLYGGRDIITDEMMYSRLSLYNDNGMTFKELYDVLEEDAYLIDIIIYDYLDQNKFKLLYRVPYSSPELVTKDLKKMGFKDEQKFHSWSIINKQSLVLYVSSNASNNVNSYIKDIKQIVKD